MIDIQARAHMRTRGFTMVELLIALLVLGVITTGALGYYMSQNRAFTVGSERASATQNLLYAASAVRRDVATAGTNLGPGQPSLVYAGADVIAFNADYVSAVPDPFAVYHDADAPAGAVMGARVESAFRIPNSPVTYPDTTYPGLGTAVSGAETLVFFFAPDTLTARDDDFALYRQVNGTPPELIARDLVALDGQPFFSYVRITAAGGVAAMADVPPADLPLRHTARAHGAAADTGAAAVIDSVRAVRLTFGSIAPGDAAASAQPARLLVWLPNASLETPRTCGSQPLFGRALNATIDNSGGMPAVRLSWSAATDEDGGEQDVMRYVIYRRRAGDAVSDEAYQSIPAGNASYLFTDRAVEAGETWIYQVAAQDCTPALSVRSTATLTIP
jgi:prepilin-type N-terminal cleavage/methylation domain-containing protein